MKPGSATFPFFGVKLALIDDHGVEIEGNPAEGRLCIVKAWPSMVYISPINVRYI